MAKSNLETRHWDSLLKLYFSSTITVNTFKFFSVYLINSFVSINEENYTARGFMRFWGYFYREKVSVEESFSTGPRMTDDDVDGEKKTVNYFLCLRILLAFQPLVFTPNILNIVLVYFSTRTDYCIVSIMNQHLRDIFK